jgi:hypothetical protein
MSKNLRDTIIIVAYFLLVLALMLLMPSCSRKQITASSNTQLIIKDSISIVEKIKLDTFIISADTITQTITIECDSITKKPKPFELKTKGNRIANILTLNTTGVLSNTCIADSLLHIIEQKEREIAVWKALAYTKDTYEIEHIKYIPKFYKICFAIALIIIGLTTLKFILKWRKIINPLW